MSRKFLSGIDLSSQKLINLLAGTAATDAANYGQVLGAEPPWVPSDSGWLAVNFDPALSAQGTTLAAGFLYVMRVNIRVAISVTNVIPSLLVAGSGLTSGQNFAGLYNSSGTLIAATADQTSAWGSTGYKAAALSGGPYSLAAATFVWVGFVANGTTIPKQAGLTSISGAPTSLAQRGVSAANSYFAFGSSGNTSMPSSFTPSTLSQVNGIPFAGLS